MVSDAGMVRASALDGVFSTGTGGPASGGPASGGAASGGPASGGPASERTSADGCTGPGSALPPQRAIASAAANAATPITAPLNSLPVGSLRAKGARPVPARLNSLPDGRLPDVCCKTASPGGARGPARSLAECVPAVAAASAEGGGAVASHRGNGPAQAGLRAPPRRG